MHVEQTAKEAVSGTISVGGNNTGLGRWLELRTLFHPRRGNRVVRGGGMVIRGGWEMDQH